MKEDQVQYPLSTIPHDHTSSLTYPILQNSQQNQRVTHREQLSQQQQSQGQDAIDQFSNVRFYFNTEVAVEESFRDHTHGLPGKWMSSKMRLMRKMMGSQGIQDQSQQNHECSSNGIIRVCSNCSTTKTPLWRSGPQGPKSLCNACGIRQMKARRAMRAAAAAISGGVVPTGAPKKVKEEERSDVDRTIPFKKRFKIAATSATAQKKLRFDDITISLSKKLAFHQTFPQEEKEAAILLMALSCT